MLLSSLVLCKTWFQKIQNKHQTTYLYRIVVYSAFIARIPPSQLKHLHSCDGQCFLTLSHWFNFIFFMSRNCTTGLPSDVTVKVGETSFFLHKVHAWIELLLKIIFWCMHHLFRTLSLLLLTSANLNYAFKLMVDLGLFLHLWFWWCSSHCFLEVDYWRNS